MILIDTSFLLGLFNPRDELRQRAQAWAHVVDGPLLVTEPVIWETVDAFSAPADRSRGHALVSHLRDADDVEIVWSNPDLFEACLQLHADRPDKSWSLTDCASFIVMDRRGIHQALTFDRHFEQAGYEALLRRDP